MRFVLYIMVFLCFSACGYNDFDPARNDTTDPRNPNISITDLRARYSGKPIMIEGVDIIFNGYVTTTDKTNNFSRTVIIDDGTGAVEIMAGTYDLHTKFAMGQLVTVVASGLVMGMYNGTLQIGFPSSDYDYEVGYIGHTQFMNHYLFVSDIYKYIRPIAVTVSEIKDNMLGRLVEVVNIQTDAIYADSTMWAPQSKAGVIKFRTSQTDSIYINTSSYATFASELIPSVPINITGILSRNKIEGRMVYQLKMRDLNDVKIY